jgi:HEAT repeat protein
MKIELLKTSLLAMFLLASHGVAVAARPYENAPRDQVIREAENLRWAAISELGLRRDKEAIPLLRKIADNPENTEPTRFRAQLSLAQLDQLQEFQNFTMGLSSTNPDEKMNAIRILGDIGTNRAVRELVKVLDDPGAPPRRKGHVQRPSYAMSAVDSLTKALPSVWAQFLKESNGKGVVPIPRWKAWWEEHSNDYK